MSKTFPQLPTEPIVCPHCATSGNHIEMERDNLDVNYLENEPQEQAAELQSYRCPDCEYVAVFRVR